MAVPLKTNTVYRAMNKRLLLFGVDRFVFLGALGIAVVIFYSMSSLLAAAVVFAVMFSVARLLTREDAQLATVVYRLCRLGRLFDSSLRK